MNLKNIIAGIIFLVLLGFVYDYVSDTRVEALEAEARVRVLEEERMELEQEVEEAAAGYEALLDSLSQAHDSIAEIREDAIVIASEASISFDEDVSVLRDSLEAYEGLGDILDRVEASHAVEVEAYQVQVETLELDKVLLVGRVAVLDSLWLLEQRINDALRTEVTALNEEADAWERAATVTFVGRLGSAIPAALVGAGIALLIR